MKPTFYVRQGYAMGEPNGWEICRRGEFYGVIRIRTRVDAEMLCDALNMLTEDQWRTIQPKERMLEAVNA